MTYSSLSKQTANCCKYGRDGFWVFLKEDFYA